jgi:hypothetical protein
MRRAEQIAAALALLAPPPSECEECRHDIEQMLDWVDSRSRAARADKTFTSKRGKASLRRYVKALRQLKAAYDALGPSIKPWFSLAETAYVVGKPTVIDRELAKAEPLLAKSAPPKPNAVRAKPAVDTAANLLRWWGHKVSVTRNGKWERLAQAFAGDGVFVFEHMRAFKHDPVIIDKLKGKTGTAILLVSKSGSDVIRTYLKIV